jgi:hypothetical protein
MRFFGSALVFGTRVLGFGALLAACSSSPSGNGPSDPGTGNGDGGRVASAPASTVTCNDVCTNVVKCGVAQASCDSICPKLSLSCQGCLAKATCNDACVAATCGNISSNPKKPPQPAAGASCDAITFDFADHAPTNSANAAGGSCTVPWDCRSQACVSGKIGTELTSFCANEGDCRNPDPSLSDPCPRGWKCAEIPSSSSGGTIRWSCLPPNANPCTEAQLSR